jgi:hypothetical protein
MSVAKNLLVKTVTKGLAMAQRVATLAIPVRTVAVMMKQDGHLEIANKAQL